MRNMSPFHIGLTIFASIGLISCDEATQMKICHKTGPCSCSNSDRSIVDLSPLALNGSARFLCGDDEFNFVYTWNPCLPYNENKCKNVSICQTYNQDQSIQYSLGVQDSAQFSYMNESEGLKLVLQYTAVGSDGLKRVSHILLTCDERYEGIFGVQKQTKKTLYVFELKSKHACPLYPPSSTIPALSPAVPTTRAIPGESSLPPNETFPPTAQQPATHSKWSFSTSKLAETTIFPTSMTAKQPNRSTPSARVITAEPPAPQTAVVPTVVTPPTPATPGSHTVSPRPAPDVRLITTLLFDILLLVALILVAVVIGVFVIIVKSYRTSAPSTCSQEKLKLKP